MGFEPTISSVTGRRLKPGWTTPADFKIEALRQAQGTSPRSLFMHACIERAKQVEVCRRQESDLRPKAYESFALPLSYAG